MGRILIGVFSLSLAFAIPDVACSQILESPAEQLARQIQDANSGWVNVPVQQTTVASLEDAILIQARQIRIRTVTAD